VTWSVSETWQDQPQCGRGRAERSRWQDPHVRTPARRTSCAAVVESSPSMRWKMSVTQNVIRWRRLTEWNIVSIKRIHYILVIRTAHVAKWPCEIIGKMIYFCATVYTSSPRYASASGSKIINIKRRRTVGSVDCVKWLAKWSTRRADHYTKHVCVFLR